MMFAWKPNCYSGRGMTCYKVLNVVNAHVVCVLPVVRVPILIYCLMKCSLPNRLQLTVFLISYSIFLSYLGCCFTARSADNYLCNTFVVSDYFFHKRWMWINRIENYTNPLTITQSFFFFFSSAKI